VAAMREHRREEHGRRFDLDRHVSYPGHIRAKAPMTYTPAAVGNRARFHCKDCPGKVFPLGSVDYSDPDAQALWLRRNPQHATGLRRLPAEHWPAAMAAYDSGEIEAQALAQSLRKRSQQTSRPGHPAAERRKQGCQRYMLEHYAQWGNREEVFESLMQIQAEDPKQWRELTGEASTVSLSTLREYWRRIDRGERVAAKARYNAKPRQERDQERAERRREKFGY
jgi:hypothetical protein